MFRLGEGCLRLVQLAHAAERARRQEERDEPRLAVERLRRALGEQVQRLGHALLAPAGAAGGDQEAGRGGRRRRSPPPAGARWRPARPTAAKSKNQSSTIASSSRIDASRDGVAELLGQDARRGQIGQRLRAAVEPPAGAAATDQRAHASRLIADVEERRRVPPLRLDLAVCAARPPPPGPAPRPPPCRARRQARRGAPPRPSRARRRDRSSSRARGGGCARARRAGIAR